MRSALKKKWVEALRSGEYKQGRGQLSCAGRFCCLGVLCEITNTGYKGSSSFPSSVSLKKFGLTSETAKTLAEKNDGGTVDGSFSPGLSFKQIANYIEKNL